MLTLLRPARDVAVMQMYDPGDLTTKEPSDTTGDTLEWWAAVDSRTQIVVKHMFEGDLPELSISFIARATTRLITLPSRSAAGTEKMILTPLEPLNG